MTPKTAHLLIIGNELLLGRVQDENLLFLAKELSTLGIKLVEVRFIEDKERDIISNVQTLSKNVDYLFVTGGLGPTHDDITSESIAKAFNVEYELNDEALKILKDYYHNLNKDFLVGSKKMAYIPRGALLLYNKLTYAPGFYINNVFVFPGVPSIMQQMFIDNKHLLEVSSPICFKSLMVNMSESKFAIELENLQQKYPLITIGSYPKLNQDNLWTTELVISSDDPELLDIGFTKLKELMHEIEGQI